MGIKLSLAIGQQDTVMGAPGVLPGRNAGTCEHRTVSKTGKIQCQKIVEGDCDVTPELCRTRPAKAINCAHLRFSLQQVSPSPLIVRFNGKTEIWDDEPPEVRLSQAACAAMVSPINSPKQCVGCVLKQPLQLPTIPPAEKPAEAGQKRRRRAVHEHGKVVPFPGRRVESAVG